MVTKTLGFHPQIRKLGPRGQTAWLVFLSISRIKMSFSVIFMVCLLIGTTLARPSKVQEDGLTSSGEDVFIMKKSDLRNDWCKTRPFKQTIRVPGCLPVQVMNNFCYGQCNSLYIPSHASQQPLFESCTSCLPQRSFMKTVTLRCPSLPVKFRKHKYLRSKKCRCSSVQRWINEDGLKPGGNWRSCSRIAWRQLTEQSVTTSELTEIGTVDREKCELTHFERLQVENTHKKGFLHRIGMTLYVVTKETSIYDINKLLLKRYAFDVNKY